MIRVALAIVCAAGFAAAEDGWTDLFNGKDLAGWEQKGGKAVYTVEDGCVVGTSAPLTENSFLCTAQHYENFVLEFEFKGHPALNSGVQVRSNSRADYKDGRVHGYQCELEDESKDRDWSCGIYDEARRGWLFPKDKDDAAGKPFGEQGKRLWKDGDWNAVKIEAKGPHIRTWLNGELRADLEDDMTPSGFIALQVHGVGAKTEPMTVRWRNIRLRPLDPAKP